MRDGDLSGIAECAVPNVQRNMDRLSPSIGVEIGAREQSRWNDTPVAIGI